MSTNKALRGRAKKLGVTNPSKLNKAQLVAAISQAQVEAGKMPTVADIQAMARELGLTGFGKLKKAELIHQLQVAEGHAACFGRIPDCGQDDCLFRPGCLP